MNFFLTCQRENTSLRKSRILFQPKDYFRANAILDLGSRITPVPKPGAQVTFPIVFSLILRKGDVIDKALPYLSFNKTPKLILVDNSVILKTKVNYGMQIYT